MRQAADSARFNFISLAGRRRTGGFGSWTIPILASFVAATSAQASDPHAVDRPVSDTPPDSSSNDAVEHSKPADALAAYRASNDGPSPDNATPGHALDGAPAGAAPSTGPDIGDGWSHGLASDGSFWFDANAGLLNGSRAADGSANSATDGFDQIADATTDNSVLVTDISFTGANSSSFQYGAPGILVSEPGGAHSSHANTIGAISSAASIDDVATADKLANFGNYAILAAIPHSANAPSPTDGANTALTSGDPTSAAAPSSPNSGAPVLAWLGDIGSGPANGTGSGSGGTLAQNQTSGSGLVINVIYDSSVANAPAGFTAAIAAVVSFYESHFTNPVTITVDVGYGEIDGQPLGSGALGESETFLTSVSYADLRSALVASANAIGDPAAVATLPTASPVSGQFWVPTAEAKALGLMDASTSVDGYVGFSNIPNLFAYNDSNGVPASQYDFFGVVAHEFSEVMGRQMLDGQNFYGAAGYEPLDLFHYSAPGVRDFSGTTPGYASADGGQTALDHFNTNPGGDFGDWAGSAGHDAFLAFSSPGVVNAVTAADLVVMSLLGWKPSSTTPPAPAPTPPAAVADYAHDTLRSYVSASYAGGVLANDSNSNPGDILSVSAVDGSAGNVGQAVNGIFGTLTLNSGGSYTYANTHPLLVALVGGVIEDTFNYTVSDGHGGTANSTLTVLITSPWDTYVTGAHGSAIQGGTAITVLDGSAGDMNVNAGSGGHQWLFGGPGDTLNGGSAADTFMFAPGFGQETINNFDPAHDVIDLPKSLFPDFAAVQTDMHASGANTVIALDANDAITLSHVTAQSLQAQNFHFII